MIHLDPTKYPCPDHGVDLTSQVKEALEETRPPVAYDPRRLFRRQPGKEDFEVFVFCPGDGTQGSGHEQVCEGRFWK